MATTVKCAKFLHSSPIPGFSSAKLSSSSSSFSSTPAQWRLPGFKGLKFRPSSTFGLVIRAEQAKDDKSTIGDIRSELARNKKKIERFISATELAWTDLSTVVDSLKKIEQEFSVEPEPKPKPENRTVDEVAPATRTEDKMSNFFLHD